MELRMSVELTLLEDVEEVYVLEGESGTEAGTAGTEQVRVLGCAN